MRPLFLFFFLCLAVRTASAQADHVPGELLLRPAAPGALDAILQRLQTVNGRATGLHAVRRISQTMDIQLLRFDADALPGKEMLAAARADAQVLEAQFNHYVTLRATEPDDPGYAQQWQYHNDGSQNGTAGADIAAPQAWDITTGGTTSDGDTIVVAVIDDGINLQHPDLAENLWKNRGEIPGNGIDDDHNGYIDDYDGWNAYTQTGQPSGGNHGTPVAGIIGARGNNGVGVAGVNWHVKLMVVRGSGSDEATVVSAYDYVLRMRKRYNLTQGAEGAFVVAANSSFGADNGHPADYPLWCAMYDSMGVAGILNVGATVNADMDVDVMGDIPTSCASDYLITVTNVKRNDMKEPAAGYGVQTVDLGAFGSGVWTLTRTGYGAFGGTSAAAPHVAGTVALMYAVPCPEFIRWAKTDPATAALAVKNRILQSGAPNADLAGITVSGRRLNTFGAVAEMQQQCGPCALPIGLDAAAPGLHGTLITWNPTPTATRYLLQYRSAADSAWTEIRADQPPVALGMLDTCTTYRYRLRSVCGTDSSYTYTRTFTFKTDGCCEAPSHTTVSSLTGTSAEVTWPPVTAATGYRLGHRPAGTAAWTETGLLTAPVCPLQNLAPCQTYEYRAATVCTGGTTPYGTLRTFRTKGCGACEEHTYCTASGDADYLYINHVIMGSLDNQSGNNGGYGDFTGSGAVTLMADSAAGITLEPVFPQFAMTANWHVWADWNQNGSFEASELVLNQSGESTVTGQITPPSGADTGITRMRIAVAGLQNPAECGDGGFGETEDYCVRVKPRAFAGITEENKPAIRLFPNPVRDLLSIRWSGTAYRQADLSDLSGQCLQTFSMPPGTENLDISTSRLAPGIYLLRLYGAGTVSVHKVIVGH